MAYLKADKRNQRTRKQQQEDFLKYFEETGNVSKSAKRAKVVLRTIYKWKETDEKFLEAYKKSEIIAVDLLEAEANRRGVEGYLEPVYQGGKKVGSVRKFSDSLLALLLKSKKRDVFGDQTRQIHEGPDGGPIKTAQVISNVDYSQLSDFVLEEIRKAKIKVQD